MKIRDRVSQASATTRAEATRCAGSCTQAWAAQGFRVLPDVTGLLY